jgi:hypothetical protein
MRYTSVLAAPVAVLTNVDLDDNDFQGKFEWVYDGPQLFYNVSF